MAIQFNPPRTGDEIVDRSFDLAKAAILALAAAPLTSARITDVVAVTTSFQNVPHGLDRKITGWLVVSPDASATVWQDTAGNNPDSSRFIRVKGSAAVNCRFLVF